MGFTNCVADSRLAMTDQRKIKVLYLINALHVGGAERVIARTVTGLDKNRYETIVCCLWMGGAAADEIEKAGVRVINLDAKNKLDFGILFRLYRLLKEHKIHIIHSFLFHANMLGRIVGRLAGVPIILSSERTMGMESKHRLLLNRITASLADKIVTVSEAVREFAIAKIGITPDRLVTIHNGVDLSEFLQSPNSERIEEAKRELGIAPSHVVVGTAGHLEEEKGCEYLLQAAAQVSAQDGKVTFLLVGDGSQRAKLEHLAEDLGISSNVIFMGYRNDVPKILSVMDVFVLPSLYEGLPNALLEAMAACRPVVATQVGGIAEVVADGETGILVPPRDPGALAGAICVLLEDRERAREMGIAGRKQVERLFSVEKMVAKTEALYEELIGEKMGNKEALKLKLQSSKPTDLTD